VIPKDNGLFRNFRRPIQFYPLSFVSTTPIYSAYAPHPGSTRLKDLLEESCEKAKRAPDVVLAGHVHNYQRFSAPLQ